MKKKMKKQILAILMVFTLLVSLFPANVGAVESDFDHLLGNDNVKKPSVGGALSVAEVDGQMTLVDQSGAKIQLRGMSTHGLQWFGEIVNENAFAALANDWDSNMIRLAMYVGESGYATNPGVKDLVYEGIELAFENDMYVIVDWHVHAPGDPRADVYEGAYDFFEELALHYKDHPKNHYIIWELANEPSSNSSGGPGITNDEAGWQAVKEYAEPITEMLREHGDNIILVGSPNWSQRPDLAADDPIDAENIMYSVHFYTGSHAAGGSYEEGTPSAERSNVMSNARYALENGVAVFATEWGTSQADGDGGPFFDEADVWLDFLNGNNISWANWSLTNKNEVSGAFTPFVLNQSNATDLDPGPDQVWEAEELSLSGEYVRARIKGIPYEPINRSRYSEVIWDFNDGTTQGFGVNPDSDIQDVTVANENNALQISGLNSSNDVSDGNYWANVRLSADDWDDEINILGANELTFDVIVEQPTTVSIAAIPQGPAAGWANPERAIQVTESDFVEQGDGSYKAVLTITPEDAPSFETIASSTAESNIMNNIILFIGTEDADVISIDNITISGNIIEAEVIHDPIGEAQFPSDFEDGTRQGWRWNGESGVQTALTIEEANGSNALSWEYAYPEVKPSDNWATAPRLEYWNEEDLSFGDSEYVAFDLYIDTIRATEGAIDINLVFQPPTAGYWAQSSDTFEIELENLDSATVTDDGLYHFEVEIDVTNMGISSDTQLRNMILIFADVDSDFAGRMFVDNVHFGPVAEEIEEPEVPATPVDEDEGDDKNTGKDKDKDKDKDAKKDVKEERKSDKEAVKAEKKDGEKLPSTATNMFNYLLLGGVLLLAGVVLYIMKKRKAIN
ncbi:carbohydrate-binding domain-containing protein [Bacillus alkalicellulosilyticus]|uniref:carbohydrate-binding domain-containing protein n=1 Tax=Alkalihalobacterium alkalicellulosilyticum TaxID=1912214 RepID=UPI001BAEBD0B|nr:carbohydrate-binding domain-containing protein [Bacillus alkalicellulosilyticus]